MNNPYTAPDFSSAALITIDMQRDTLPGRPLEVPGTDAAVPPIACLLEAFRAASLPIVHLVRLYDKDGHNADLPRRALIESGREMLSPRSDGSQLISDLLPQPDIRLDPDLLLAGDAQRIGPNEVIIYKPRWGAFYKTPLETHLHELGVTTLIFTGCNFPNCPRTSIYEASERDFRIVVAEDAVSGIYPTGIDELRAIGTTVCHASEIPALRPSHA